MAYEWAVYRTAFHGGGRLSRHRTREAADRAARRYRMTDCVCGCAVVVPIDQEPRQYAEEMRNPYAPAL